MVLETSTGHAVAESQSLADQNEKARCCTLPDRGCTRASTANHRSHSGTCVQAHGSTGLYHAVMLEVPRRRPRNGKLPQCDITKQTKCQNREERKSPRVRAEGVTTQRQRCFPARNTWRQGGEKEEVQTDPEYAAQRRKALR